MMAHTKTQSHQGVKSFLVALCEGRLENNPVTQSAGLQRHRGKPADCVTFCIPVGSYSASSMPAVCRRACSSLAISSFAVAAWAKVALAMTVNGVL